MEKQSLTSGFEFWGGVEATLNRVGDNYFDQLLYTGHYDRPQDIEKIAGLGLTKLRYPVLWERHEQKPHLEIDWGWATKQLQAMRAEGIEPIVGLVHHGSGPAFTSLTDPMFPELLAAYAGKVARQFPWVRHYTPVNEPLTTSRFSGLYGFWYPHWRDSLSALRMLLTQVKGIVLSMKAIREVTPDAKLVQTEDLAKTHGSPELQYQIDFENERRWLTYDLLLGKVDRNHSLWDFLLWVGLGEDELSFFTENPLTPDIAGFNYYVTSERFLDVNIHRYPAHLHGGNHRDRYVDTEAIRVKHEGSGGLSTLLMEAWDRFGLPMAVTEAFMSCTEDEQVRWLNDMCEHVQNARLNGADIRALTFWALLGEFSWNKLVTSMDGEYESGAFYAWDGEFKETLVADYIKALTLHGTFSPRWLSVPGWWKREDRYHLEMLCIEK